MFGSEQDGGGLFVMEATGENFQRVTRKGYLPAWAPDSRHVVYSEDTFSVPSARGAPLQRLLIYGGWFGTDPGDGGCHSAQLVAPWRTDRILGY